MTRTHGVLAAVMLSFYIISVTLAGGSARLLGVALVHLFILNLFLGILEASILRRGFGARRKTALPRMILANYLGLGIGAVAVTWLLNMHLQFELQNGLRQVLVSFGVVFLVSWALKFPFVARCLRRRSRWFGRSLVASFGTHALSSLILLVWYLTASEFTLYTSVVTHNAPVSQVASREASCYYISSEDGNAYGCALDADQQMLVMEPDSIHPIDRLEIRQHDETRCMTLFAVTQGETGEFATELDISVCGDDVLLFPPGYSGTRGSEVVLDIRQPERRHYEFSAGSASNPGLEIGRLVPSLDARGRYLLKRDKTRLAFQTPFLRCPVSHVTILPGDLVVFQIAQQICLFDPSSRMLRQIAAGRSPVVLLHR